MKGYGTRGLAIEAQAGEGGKSECFSSRFSIVQADSNVVHNTCIFCRRRPKVSKDEAVLVVIEYSRDVTLLVVAEYSRDTTLLVVAECSRDTVLFVVTKGSMEHSDISGSDRTVHHVKHSNPRIYSNSRNSRGKLWEHYFDKCFYFN